MRQPSPPGPPPPPPGPSLPYLQARGDLRKPLLAVISCTADEKAARAAGLRFRWGGVGGEGGGGGRGRGLVAGFFRDPLFFHLLQNVGEIKTVGLVEKADDGVSSIL